MMIIETMLMDVLFIGLIILSMAVVVSKSLIRALIYLSASTFVLVAVLFLLKAPDVAITEAIVGTGATVAIYLLVLRKVEVISAWK